MGRQKALSSLLSKLLGTFLQPASALISQPLCAQIGMRLPRDYSQEEVTRSWCSAEVQNGHEQAICRKVEAFLFKIVLKKVKVELLKNPWACDSRRSVRAHHSSLFPAKQRQEVPESCAA